MPNERSAAGQAIPDRTVESDARRVAQRLSGVPDRRLGGPREGPRLPSSKEIGGVSDGVPHTKRLRRLWKLTVDRSSRSAPTRIQRLTLAHGARRPRPVGHRGPASIATHRSTRASRVDASRGAPGRCSACDGRNRARGMAAVAERFFRDAAAVSHPLKAPSMRSSSAPATPCEKIAPVQGGRRAADQLSRVAIPHMPASEMEFGAAAVLCSHSRFHASHSRPTRSCGSGAATQAGGAAIRSLTDAGVSTRADTGDGDNPTSPPRLRGGVGPVPVLIKQLRRRRPWPFMARVSGVSSDRPT